MGAQARFLHGRAGAELARRLHGRGAGTPLAWPRSWHAACMAERAAQRGA